MVLDALLAATPPRGLASVTDWFAATATARASHPTPLARALVGGAHADRLGFAFAAGYAEALRHLVPDLAGIGALCATEANGNHPRAIKTRLEGTTLTGAKRWATGASYATSLLVVATTGDDPVTNLPRLRVARISTTAPNLRITPTAAPFIPEIEHAALTLDGVPVDAILPGDGYTDYLKPFRTVEDLHVHAAVVGYLLGVTRRYALPAAAALAETLLALAAASLALATTNLRTPAAHLALAGLLELVARAVADVEHAWSTATPTDDEWLRWQRDRPLLQVAAKARVARRDKARSSLMLSDR